MITDIQKKNFYDRVRSDLYHGKLSQPQVSGIEALLHEYNSRNLTNLQWLAYVMATAYHETAKTMQPVAEYGHGAGRSYGQKLKYGGGPGKRIPYTVPDHIYYGRGHTQNTWYENYQALTNQAKREGKSWNFLYNPDILLQNEPSAWATFHAMLSGMYTGHSLKEFFNDNREDPEAARLIINGTDCKERIAEHYHKFLSFLH
jgi:putative chitinase